jgi:hypothetical protein
MANSDNPRRGRDFENAAREFFRNKGLALETDFPVRVGVGKSYAFHKFDLASEDPPILVECKRHTWSAGGNAPSAKLIVWNEAMLYFLAAPSQFRKILFVLRSLRNGESLAEHYLKRFRHLVPDGVEIW